MKEVKREQDQPKLDPTDLAPEARAFHEYVFGHQSLLDGLSKIQREYYLVYLTSLVSLKEVGKDDRKSYAFTNRRIRDAIQVLHAGLPPEINHQFDLKTIQRLRTPKARNPIKRGPEIIVEKQKKRGPGIVYGRPVERKKPSSGAASEDAAQPPQQDIEAEERMEAKKIKKDLSREEKEEDPVKGARFNYLFINYLIPDELRKFLRGSPGLEIENWISIGAKLWDHPHITLRGGDLYFIDGDLEHVLTLQTIEQYFNGSSSYGRKDARPEAIKHFARLTFEDIKSDMERVAIEAGYKPEAKIKVS